MEDIRSVRSGVVGGLDRAIRAVLGLVLLGFAAACPWAASFGPVVTWPSALIGAALFVTAVAARCPLYRLFGVRT